MDKETASFDIRVFDDIIEFTSIQKEFTKNLLIHSPTLCKDKSQVIEDVLLKKILDFTVDTIGTTKCLAYINSKLDK